jgi:hypothetical protein
VTFKEAVKRDVTTVFHNAEEFAVVTKVSYGGKHYEIPVVMDRAIETDRKQPSSDHAGGVFLADVRAYINAADWNGSFPRKLKRIEISGEDFKIARVSEEMGEIVLDLEMFDE